MLLYVMLLAQQMIDIDVTTKYNTLKKAYECDYSVVVFGQGEE